MLLKETNDSNDLIIDSLLLFLMCLSLLAAK